MTGYADFSGVVRHSVEERRERPRIFGVQDFFMVRAAALPWHLRDDAWRDVRFREAVALASPSLLARLDVGEGGTHDPRSDPKVAQALSRYGRRMTTRPTPFGLFAGVGVGHFGPASDVSLGALKDWKRQARPDMDWLLALVRSLETDAGLCPSVKVYPNPLVLMEGERIVLTNPSRWDVPQGNDGKENLFNISIRATRPVALALDLARTGPSLDQLTLEVAAALDEADKSRVERMVRDLLSREFLFSELRPPSGSPNPLRHVSDILARMAAHRHLAKALQNLESLITDYVAASPAEGTASLQKVRAAMAPLTRSTRDLHVDLAIPAAGIALPAAVGSEFARSADVMWRLTNDNSRLEHLRDYHVDFLTRFGVDREVPLTEILHEEMGLGPPQTYLEPRPTRSAQNRAPPVSGMTRLAELCYAAAARGEREILLTESLIDELAPERPAEAPPSFELYGEVLAASSADLDRGAFRLVLSPIVGADEAGKTFGRFLYFLPETIGEGLRSIRRAQSAAEPDIIYAELSHIPASAKVANMALTPCLSDYELTGATSASLAESRSIALADLVVGATPDRLYLKSRPTGREVVVTTAHMLNYELLPNALRLALEISLGRARPFALLNMGSLQRAAFYPRISYRRTILSPATWNFRRNDIAPPGAAWRASFHAWRVRWSVPRFVFVGFADQRLLLDLENDAHVDEIESRLRKQDSLAMIEMVGTFEDRVFSSDGGRHFTECVVPLVRIAAAAPSRVPPARFGGGASAEMRLRLPGSDWLFLKLYCNPDRLDRLLVEQVAPFADACVSSGLADGWFYLNYKDPESHLRLRFHTRDPAARSRLLEESGQWAGTLMRRGQLRDMMVATYEREIERYGGPELIQHAEEFFCEDSRMCAELVSAQLSGEIDLDRVQLMAIGVADIVARAGYLGRSNIFLSGKLENAHRFSPLLRETCAGILAINGAKSSMQGDRIGHRLDRRATTLNSYLSAIRSTIPADVRETEMSAILQSLIHMQCNRMNGDERSALALAKRIANWASAITADTRSGS